MTDLNTIHNIPKRALEVLTDESQFKICTSKVIDEQKSASGCKFVIELGDGRLIETVMIQHMRKVKKKVDKIEIEVETGDNGGETNHKKENKGTNPDARSKVEGESNEMEKTEEDIYEEVFGHNTVCVSSQVGCRMGCRFCATGTMGLLGNLTAGEIVEQVYHVTRRYKIRNIVYMGMGEPLDNYNNVLSSLRTFSDNSAFSLSLRNITVSTVGVVSAIKRLAVDCPTARLALSLHASNQQVRNRYVNLVTHPLYGIH